MVPKQVLRGWDDGSQPTVRNLAEVLDTLRRHGLDLEDGRLWFEVPFTMSSPKLIARLLFSAKHDDIDVRFDLPMLHGVKAQSTLDVPRNLPLESLDRAEVDSRGNVTLTDGTSVHAVKFDLVEGPGPWTDVDEAIVWLTIKAFKTEHIFLRRYFPTRPSEKEPAFYRCVGIDYGILHTLREPNIKILTRYINEHIGALSRENGKPPFKPVAISRVQRTLNIAGVSKVRGHKRRLAA